MAKDPLRGMFVEEKPDAIRYSTEIMEFSFAQRST
jgi:hypothetical protein